MKKTLSLAVVCGSLAACAPASGIPGALTAAASGSPDGANPNGDAIAVHGALYGTTMHGGPANAGTIFGVRP
jgi:uncharacterized repeat protein (TIGR03803 family)